MKITFLDYHQILMETLLVTYRVQIIQEKNAVY